MSVRGRRGRVDRLFVAELTVDELGLLVDVLADVISAAEQNAELFGYEDDWNTDYQLARSRKLVFIRLQLQLANPKREVDGGFSDEEQ